MRCGSRCWTRRSSFCKNSNSVRLIRSSGRSPPPRRTTSPKRRKSARRLLKRVPPSPAGRWNRGSTSGLSYFSETGSYVMAKPKQPDHTFEMVERLAAIPDFQSEEEEHAFWSTHELGEEL